jgi:flagellar biosynthesis chaperone FliJ
MSQSTISKVRNYQGTNSFVNKMKSVVNQYGSLTIKQTEAVEKCLKASTVVESKELPEDVKRIVDYTGENSFVKEIASKFKKYATLSEKQVSAAINQIQKEEDKERTIRMNWPTVG